MSLTSDELNYLIWRYFQESGLEVSALALLDESTVAQFDERFHDTVPIGSLVSLVQKGILYSEVDNLVSPNGEVLETEKYQERFTMFHALGANSAQYGSIPPNKGRFEENHGTDTSTSSNDVSSDIKVNGNGTTDDGTNRDREMSPDYVTVLAIINSFSPSTTSEWNPASSCTFAYGMTESRANITTLKDGADPQQLSLHHPHAITTQGNGPDITVVSWSPKGDSLITAVESGEIRCWTSEGRLRNVMTMHQAPVIAAKWSPKADHILTTDAENVTILWDASSGAALHHFDTLKQGIQQQQPQQQQPQQPPQSQSQQSQPQPQPTTPTLESPVLGTDITWIDDNRFIVPGLNGSALVFNSGSRQPAGTLFGHTKPLSVVDFSSEYQYLLTASDDRTVRVWNGATFNSNQVLIGHSQPITMAGWLTGDFVISCGLDASIRLWSVHHGNQVDMEVTDGVPILIGSLSPDKTRIAVGLTDGLMMLYSIDLKKEKALKKVGEIQPSLSVEVDPGNVITSVSWNSDSSKIVLGYSHSESVVVKSL